MTVSLNVIAQDLLFLKTYTVNIQRQTAYETWMTGYPGNPEATGPSGDLDGDGVSNLIEYAFGQNPASGGSMALPQPQIQREQYVVSFAGPVTFPPVSGTYGAAWSADLQTNGWTPIPDTGTPGTHRFSVPIGSRTRMFMKLTVGE